MRMSTIGALAMTVIHYRRILITKLIQEQTFLYVVILGARPLVIAFHFDRLYVALLIVVGQLERATRHLAGLYSSDVKFPAFILAVKAYAETLVGILIRFHHGVQLKLQIVDIHFWWVVVIVQRAGNIYKRRKAICDSTYV